MVIFCRYVDRILLLRYDELVSSAAMPNSLALIGQTLSQQRLSMTSTHTCIISFILDFIICPSNNAIQLIPIGYDSPPGLKSFHGELTAKVVQPESQRACSFHRSCMREPQRHSSRHKA